MKIEISKLSASEIDELLAEAAKRRAELYPEHPLKAPQQVEAILNPAWYTAPADIGSILQLRHPGFGWISFVIPPAERAHLLSLLLQQALLHNNHNNIAPDSTAPTASGASGGKLH